MKDGEQNQGKLINEENGKAEDWLGFLANEGLEVLAAYRAIRNPEVRAMHIRLMKDAARAEREGNSDLN